MEEVTLRGHHILNFYDYYDDRIKGQSHQTILTLNTVFRRYPMILRADRFAVYLYRNIFEGKVKTIRLIDTLDDLCLGPKREAREWCKYYNPKCDGPSIRDQLFIIQAGFSQEKVSCEDFVSKVHNARSYLLDGALENYYSNVLGLPGKISDYDIQHKELNARLPPICQKLCFSFLEENK